MENPDYTMDEFLKDLDTINEFCDQTSLNESTYGDDYYKSVCDGCPIDDYCHKIPTRSSCVSAFRNVKKCVEIIRDYKGGEV